jgi:hypothetical protein
MSKRWLIGPANENVGWGKPVLHGVTSKTGKMEESMPSTTDMAATGDVSPALLVETMFAFRKTAAIKAAIELDLFTEVAGGAATAKALAAKTNASERGLRVLCDFLTVLGFLTKNGDVYQPTPSTLAFLDRRSPPTWGRRLSSCRRLKR